MFLDGGDSGGNPDPDPKKTPDGGGKSKIEFTAELQKHVDELVGRARVEGRDVGSKSAVAELLKELGVEKPEDVKTALADYKKLQDASKSELQKAQDAATEAAKKIETATAEKQAMLDRMTEMLKREQVMAAAKKHVPPFRDDALEDVWMRVDKTKITAEGDVTEDLGNVKFKGVEDAVKQVAKDKAHWLVTKSGSGGTPRPGTPSGNREEQKKPILRL
jgi:hypothetical protein